MNLIQNEYGIEINGANAKNNSVSPLSSGSTAISAAQRMRRIGCLIKDGASSNYDRSIHGL